MGAEQAVARQVVNFRSPPLEVVQWKRGDWYVPTLLGHSAPSR